MRRARAGGLAAQDGVGLIEVLVTILVLGVGILVTLSVFTGSGRAAAVADRYNKLISVAQREVEKLRPIEYDQLGLSAAVPASASEAPLTGSAATEAKVTGGVVNPGPEPFQLEGVTGRIYRYVTWRYQSCPLLQGSIASNIAAVLGQPLADVTNALTQNLCPAAEQTKRITVVVVADVVGDIGPDAPYRLSTVAVDPSSGLLAANNLKGLKVDMSTIIQALTSNESLSTAGATYSQAISQSLYLYDTRCDFATRQAITASHDTHNTSLQGSTCTGSGRPDLMGLSIPPGTSAGTLLYDYSSDLTRPAQGGLALMRDEVGGNCQSNLGYNSGATQRKRSVHTWATKTPAAPAETATTAGRATLTFTTSTALAQEGPGRLCLVVRLASTGQILGSVDYTMPTWPAEPTQLAVSFDIAHAVIATTDRLLLTARVPSDSGSDLELYYDHPAYPSALSLAMVKDKPLS